MSAPPLSYLEKRWASGYRNGFGDQLIRTSRVQVNRPFQAQLDTDTFRSVSPYGRRMMMTLARWLYWNSSAVRSAVNDTAFFSASSFVPQFEGKDQAWGALAEDWMWEHDKICHTRGWPYNMATLRKNAIVGAILDGDHGVILCKTEAGYPRISSVPGHRIGNGTFGDTVLGGDMDGAKIVDGVIVDDYLSPIGYRVLDASDVGFRDYAARDMMLVFSPFMSDMVRGLSIVGCAAFEWEDLRKARELEIAAQRLASSVGIVEHNEKGEADDTEALLGAPEFDDDGKLRTMTTETVDGVENRYYRAGSNSTLETLKFDRPSVNQRAFRDDVMRELLEGMGWSFDFGLNPTQAGGASMRIVIEKINRRIDEVRSVLVESMQRRIDGFRVSCAVQLKQLPFNPDWWRWSYQGSAKLTADAQYDSNVDIQQRKGGSKTLAKSAAQQGDYWRDIRKQKRIEAEDLLTTASELAKTYGTNIEFVVSLLEKPDTNPIQQSAEAQPANAAPQQ